MMVEEQNDLVSKVVCLVDPNPIWFLVWKMPVKFSIVNVLLLYRIMLELGGDLLLVHQGKVQLDLLYVCP